MCSQDVDVALLCSAVVARSIPARGCDVLPSAVSWAHPVSPVYVHEVPLVFADAGDVYAEVCASIAVEFCMRSVPGDVLYLEARGLGQNAFATYSALVGVDACDLLDDKASVARGTVADIFPTVVAAVADGFPTVLRKWMRQSLHVVGLIGVLRSTPKYLLTAS